MELYHFNHNHDPRNGQFTQSKNSLVSRSYKKDIKKLKKLEDRADVDLQREKAKKYKNRADKAAKVAKISGGVALATFNTGGTIAGIARSTKNKIISDQRDYLNSKYLIDMHQRSADISRESISRYEDMLSRNLDSSSRERYSRLLTEEKRLLRNDTDHINEFGKIVSEKVGNRENSIESKIATFEAAKNVVAATAAATAAVSAGVYGYNKVQQKMAERRTTEIGHAKAVEKAKQQTQKILDKYADVKIDDIYADLDKMRNN